MVENTSQNSVQENMRSLKDYDSVYLAILDVTDDQILQLISLCQKIANMTAFSVLLTYTPSQVYHINKMLRVFANHS